MNCSRQFFSLFTDGTSKLNGGILLSQKDYYHKSRVYLFCRLKNSNLLVCYNYPSTLGTYIFFSLCQMIWYSCQTIDGAVFLRNIVGAILIYVCLHMRCEQLSRVYMVIARYFIGRIIDWSFEQYLLLSCSRLLGLVSCHINKNLLIHFVPNQTLLFQNQLCRY